MINECYWCTVNIRVTFNRFLHVNPPMWCSFNKKHLKDRFSLTAFSFFLWMAHIPKLLMKCQLPSIPPSIHCLHSFIYSCAGSQWSLSHTGLVCQCIKGPQIHKQTKTLQLRLSSWEPPVNLTYMFGIIAAAFRGWSQTQILSHRIRLIWKGWQKQHGVKLEDMKD